MQGNYVTVLDLTGKLLDDNMTTAERGALIALAAIWSGRGHNIIEAETFKQYCGNHTDGIDREGIVVKCPPDIDAEALKEQLTSDYWSAVANPTWNALLIWPKTPSAQLDMLD